MVTEPDDLIDDLMEALQDASDDGEGRLRERHVRHHLEKAGLVVVKNERNTVTNRLDVAEIIGRMIPAATLLNEEASRAALSFLSAVVAAKQANNWDNRSKSVPVLGDDDEDFSDRSKDVPLLRRWRDDFEEVES